MTAEAWEQVAAFIEARTCEDAVAALATRADMSGDLAHESWTGKWVYTMDGVADENGWGIVIGGALRDGGVEPHCGMHIARHDPASVLRRVDADRKLLAQVRGMAHRQTEEFPVYGDCRSLFQPGDLGDLGVGYCDCGVDQLRMAILCPVASVWAEHPDYPAATP